MSTLYVPAIEKRGHRERPVVVTSGSICYRHNDRPPSPFSLVDAKGLAAAAHKLTQVHRAILSLIKMHTFQRMARDLKTM